MADKQFLGLRMRQLPRAEYHLMKHLVQRYNLRDESELFAVLLRLLTVIRQYTSNNVPMGDMWIAQAIESVRSESEADRAAAYAEQ